MSDLIRWEPREDLIRLRDAMDRLFEDRLGRSPSSFLSTFEVGPALDIYETGDAVVVEAALPGVQAEDIEVTVTGDLLTIKGETKEDTTVEREHYYRRERRYGSFTRSVHLPGAVKAGEASAEFRNGVLRLTVPKTEETKAKVIEVKAVEP